MISDNAIQAEDLLQTIISDIVNILKVTKITPKKITLYTATSIKTLAYHAILEQVLNEQTNMGIIMKELIANSMTSDIKQNPDFVAKAIKDILSEPTEIRKTRLKAREFDEKRFLSRELESVIQQEFGVEVSVFAEDDEDVYDPKGKARHARPFKPAILIE